MEKTFDWVKAMLGLGIKEASSDSAQVLRRKKIAGEIVIEVERNGKKIAAYVDIDYFRRPSPSTYWIDGDLGDDGEVILGLACDKWGREIVLTDEEQEQAIEAFKSA